MSKSIIYYTDGNLSDPLYSFVQEQLLKTGLPIVSSSLNKPIDFGDNAVVKGKRSYPTMVKQIISCLERSTADYVFFSEHDVLYSPSHFNFVPPLDNIFYYNVNIWRWSLGSDIAIRHDRMIPLSSLCVNREFALDHYKRRLELILERGLDSIKSPYPKWVRKMGFEPGTKTKKRGGFSDDEYDTWSSADPNIDIRHDKTFSPTKISKGQFTHTPKWWKEIPVKDISNWDLKGIFK